MRRLICSILLALPWSAAAQLDQGTIMLTAGDEPAGLVDTRVTVLPDGTRRYEERWIVPQQLAWPGGRRAVVSMTQTPAPSGVRLTKGLVRFTASYAYEAPSPEDVLDLSALAFGERAEQEVLADRVTIDGAVVGWRLRRIEAGRIHEAWLLTGDYSPPRPTPLTRSDVAMQNGWSRPYVDTVELLPARAVDVAEELSALVEDGSLDSADPEGGLLLARFSYRPVPDSLVRVPLAH